MKNELFVCNCEFLEHSFVLSIDDGDGWYGWIPSAYISVHLCQCNNFFGRLKNAVRYLVGGRSRYGDYAEFILKYNDVSRLIDMLTAYKKLLSDSNIE
jgi:hypothetical protein